MMTNETNNNHEDRGMEILRRPPDRTRILWQAATALALLVIVFLIVDAHQLASTVSALRETTQAQIARLNDQLAQSSEESNRRLSSFAQEARDSTASAEVRARSELRKTGATLSAKLAEQEQTEEQARRQVAGELDNLQQASSSASSKLTEISGDVSSVKGDVASTQSALQQTGSELKRVNGDMGVMSGLIATNHKELLELRELGERDYLEFDLKKNGGMQKVGGMQLALGKADPKRNRFTLDVLADDKRVEKRDRTINEPVQLYVAGSRLPYEIVINQVNKDEVVGYLAVPKVKMAKR